MGSSRLILVDDNEAIGGFMRGVAEPLGYAVEAYANATDFETALERGDPEVIVLDLVMPGTDGIEILRRLAQRQSRARIFIMSGFDPTYQRMAVSLGESHGLTMAGIIRKPVRAADLRALLTPPAPVPE